MPDSHLEAPAPSAETSGLTPVMLNHAAWVTHDVAATTEFYTKVMGMELASTIFDDKVPSTGDAFPYFHIFFRMQDGSTIAFFEAPGLPAKPVPLDLLPRPQRHPPRDHRAAGRRLERPHPPGLRRPGKVAGDQGAGQGRGPRRPGSPGRADPGGAQAVRGVAGPPGGLGRHWRVGRAGARHPILRDAPVGVPQDEVGA
jgi:catechol 2,3-dioxygenase-like lactoylglutathione lyase family enzyme